MSDLWAKRHSAQHPGNFVGKMFGCLIGLVSVVILAATAGTIAKALLKPVAVDCGFGVPDIYDLEKVEEDHTSELQVPTQGSGATIEWICRTLVTRREILREVVPADGLTRETMGDALRSVGIVGLSADDVVKVFDRMV